NGSLQLQCAGGGRNGSSQCAKNGEEQLAIWGIAGGMEACTAQRMGRGSLQCCMQERKRRWERVVGSARGADTRIPDLNSLEVYSKYSHYPLLRMNQILFEIEVVYSKYSHYPLLRMNQILFEIEVVYSNYPFFRMN